MDVLAMRNVGKAVIPMYKIRYICFYFMFLYSLAVFISLPKGGPEEEQKLMRLKNSMVKHQRWHLIITHGHHPYTTPLPNWDLSNTQKCQVLFLLTSGIKCSGRNLQWSDVFSFQCSVFTQSSFSVAGLGPRPKGCHLTPFSNSQPCPFFPPHYQKPDTYISFYSSLIF